MSDPHTGHAQAAVTNVVFKHLGEPKTFLFCPTEYCATRATPNVATSEYLRTLGEKLHPSIDVMWTGPQVGLEDCSRLPFSSRAYGKGRTRTPLAVGLRMVSDLQCYG